MTTLTRTVNIRCPSIVKFLNSIMITSFFKRAGSTTSKSSDKRDINQDETLQFDGSDPASNEFGSVFLSMPIEEKRKLYHCRKYVDIEELSTWPVHYKVRRPAIVRRIQQKSSHKRGSGGDSWNNQKVSDDASHRKVSDDVSPVSDVINNKICLWQGDITRLEVDGIVNAANKSLMGGGGVDGSIHRAAGHTLKRECASLHGCNTGEAKITSGHELPARYILHTVGPVGERTEKLRNCYQNCLGLVAKYKLRSVAFCCISTGVYGYPNRPAAEVALQTTRQWLQDHHSEVDRVIFCTFLDTDFDIYEELMAGKYFPVDEDLFHAPALTGPPESPGEIDDILELAPSPPAFEPRDDWESEEWDEDDAINITAMSQDQSVDQEDVTAMSQEQSDDQRDSTAMSQDFKSHCNEDDAGMAMSQDVNDDVDEVADDDVDDDDVDVDGKTVNACAEVVVEDSGSSNLVETVHGGEQSTAGTEPTNSPAKAKRSKSEEH